MRRSLTLLALLLVLPVSACGRAEAPAPPPVGDVVDDVGVAPDELSADPTPDVSISVAPDPPEDPMQKALEDSWHPDPRGTVAQISLRFVQALQRGDDIAALRQLDREERLWLSFRDVWTLHRVMSDVRKNAGLADAGPCSRVRQLSKAAAVVTCGERHVVVNADPWVGLTGVRLSDWTLHHDVFHGPHTHAYTLMEL